MLSVNHNQHACHNQGGRRHRGEDTSGVQAEIFHVRLQFAEPLTVKIASSSKQN
jgi:hypothetical protein